MGQKILVIEDDIDIRDIIHAFLEDAGYDVATANDGLEGIERFKAGKFDLVVLDIMMPKINGFVVCEMIRKSSDIPVIILTALDDESNQIKGFELKADDYVTKPFSNNLLLKRVEAVLRRSRRHQQEQVDNSIRQLICYRDLQIDRQAYKAFVNGSCVELTTKEFEVLVELLDNKGRVLTRDSILENLWGYDFIGDVRVVDTHIKNIRRKLGLEYIETIRGVGYRIDYWD